MKVLLEDNNYKYVIQELLKVFTDDPEFITDINNHYDRIIKIEIEANNKKVLAKSILFEKNKIIDKNIIERDNKSLINENIKSYYSRVLKLCVFNLLEKYYEPKSQWGILTGMRPVKVVHKYLDNGYTYNELEEILLNDYKIQKNKVDLMMKIAKKEREYIYPINHKEFDLYIGIPFCISRCKYCSFPSNILDKKKEKVDIYLDKLLHEVTETIMLTNKYNFQINSLYIGGGTPSILNIDQLKKLLKKLKQIIDLDKLKEFTFEAGRPNTIDENKLKLLKDYKVSRICLNPQTLNDEILHDISRGHTSKDIYETYKMIKSLNFNSINMDLMVGLPNQDIGSFKKTLENVKDMSPENITIHTLSIKRGSYFNKKGYEYDNVKQVEKMLKYSYNYLSDSYNPYYMYRQKNITGNLENVGFSKEGFESIYNMRIMEEKHTILACGAGATSKFNYPNRDRFDRVANSKGLEDYMDRVEEMIDRKRKAFKNII